jgi:hypothetical protein
LKVVVKLPAALELTKDEVISAPEPLYSLTTVFASVASRPFTVVPAIVTEIVPVVASIVALAGLAEATLSLL